MEYSYDPGTDTLTINISEESPDYGEQAGSIIYHYSEDGKPVEIEILDASETVMSMIKPILSSSKEKAEV